MQREHPGKKQADLLNSIFFSLPHNPIPAMANDNSDTFSDDDDFSDSEQESPLNEDELSEDLSCDSSSEDEDLNEDDELVLQTPPSGSLAKSMKERHLYGPSSPSDSPSPSSNKIKTKRLVQSAEDSSDDSDGFEEVQIKEPTRTTQKTSKKESPKKRKESLAATIRRQNQSPIKLGGRKKTVSSSTSKKTTKSAAQRVQDIDFQTIKKLKMENGTYRGKIGYVVKRGNVDSKFLLVVDKRRRTGTEKPKTITEQIKMLVDSKTLKFRDLTYVYIEEPGNSPGIFAAGLFTTSGTIAHINATTIELPAYKSLYAEQSGKNHRQAKIKEVIACNNEQKDTDFVLKIDTDNGEQKMLQLRLPFLSTQAFLSIINEDKRVTKQRKNNLGKSPKKSADKCNSIDKALKHLAQSAEKKVKEVKASEVNSSELSPLAPFPESTPIRQDTNESQKKK